MKIGKLGLIFVFLGMLENCVFSMQQIPSLKELCLKTLIKEKVKLNEKNIPSDIIENRNGYLSETSKNLTTSEDPITALMFSHCGQFLALAIDDGRIKIYNICYNQNTEKQHHTYSSFAYEAYSYIKNLFIAEDKACLAEFKAHGSKILKLEFSRCGRYLISFSEDNEIKIWDLSDYNQQKSNFMPILKIESSADIDSLAIQQLETSKNELLLAIRQDLEVKIYYLNLNKNKKDIFGDTFIGSIATSTPNYSLNSIAISNDCKHIAIGDDEKIKILELAFSKDAFDCKQAIEIPIPGKIIKQLYFSKTLQFLSLTNDNILNKWELDFSSKEAYKKLEKPNCSCFTTNPQLRCLVILTTTSEEPIFEIYKVNESNLECIQSFSSGNCLFQKSAIDPSGCYLALTKKRKSLPVDSENLYNYSYSFYIVKVWNINHLNQK